jgi:hypothetical protein
MIQASHLPCCLPPASQVQVGALNILALALVQASELSARVKAALAEDRTLIPSLMALTDHSVPLLRAKALVCALLLCRCGSAASHTHCTVTRHHDPSCHVIAT